MAAAHEPLVPGGSARPGPASPVTLARERTAFAKRLRDSLKRAKVDPRSTSRVTREFNLRYVDAPVTTQAVRKWLAGEALPSQDKMRALAEWLDVPMQWLHYGESDARVAASRAMARQERAPYRVDVSVVARKVGLLNEEHQKIVLEVVHALLRLEGKR